MFEKVCNTEKDQSNAKGFLNIMAGAVFGAAIGYIYENILLGFILGSLVGFVVWLIKMYFTAKFCKIFSLRRAK